jgi:hypothetical protein
MSICPTQVQALKTFSARILPENQLLTVLTLVHLVDRQPTCTQHALGLLAAALTPDGELNGTQVMARDYDMSPLALALLAQKKIFWASMIVVLRSQDLLSKQLALTTIYRLTMRCTKRSQLDYMLTCGGISAVLVSFIIRHPRVLYELQQY